MRGAVYCGCAHGASQLEAAGPCCSAKAGGAAQHVDATLKAGDECRGTLYGTLAAASGGALGLQPARRPARPAAVREPSAPLAVLDVEIALLCATGLRARKSSALLLLTRRLGACDCSLANISPMPSQTLPDALCAGWLAPDGYIDGVAGGAVTGGWGCGCVEHGADQRATAQCSRASPLGNIGATDCSICDELAKPPACAARLSCPAEHSARHVRYLQGSPVTNCMCENKPTQHGSQSDRRRAGIPADGSWAHSRCEAALAFGGVALA
jgi:hypothetical protein